MKTQHLAIAIDGPAASGKSTLAKLLAQRLGIVMVNSGAMYRAVTWSLLQDGIDLCDEEAVEEALDLMQLKCGDKDYASTIAVKGTILNEELRDVRVNHAVSQVAALRCVRERLISLQRHYLEYTDVVMEGRDIGTVVFPDTPYKIFIDADEQIRASRRQSVGEEDSVAARDAADSKRSISPLVRAPGAMILDTSHMNLEQSIAGLMSILKQQGYSKL